MDLEGTLWALKLKRNTLLPSWKARGCGEVIMPSFATPRMESWTQDTTATFCLILANHFVDGWMVWSGMGICMWFLLGRIQGYNRALHLSQASSQVFVLVFLWLRIIGGERSLTTCQTGIVLDE